MNQDLEYEYQNTYSSLFSSSENLQIGDFISWEEFPKKEICKFVIGFDSKNCPITCNKLYKNKDSLRVHMKSHRGLFNYKCKYCGKSYTTAGNKNDHERRHLKEKPFLCKAN